jgi:hypothetical protein
VKKKTPGATPLSLAPQLGLGTLNVVDALDEPVWSVSYPAKNELGTGAAARSSGFARLTELAGTPAIWPTDRADADPDPTTFADPDPDCTIATGIARTPHTVNQRNTPRI